MAVPQDAPPAGPPKHSVSSMPFAPVGHYPNSGIDVLVIGTGLAGLSAAIECVRKGHNVRVLERNSTINTAGTSLVAEAAEVAPEFA